MELIILNFFKPLGLSKRVLLQTLMGYPFLTLINYYLLYIHVMRY